MSEPFADVGFRLRGKSLPLDHGYSLFSALSRLLPALHGAVSWGVHPVFGSRSGPGTLGLVPTSELTIRLPAREIGSVLPLVGLGLDVDGHQVQVGRMNVRPLRPAATLKARFVTIKGFHGDVDPFREAVARQLRTLGVEADVVVGGRRVMRIVDRTVVGFPVGLDGLSPDASLAVQAAGIGGRRHLGAGIFAPVGLQG